MNEPGETPQATLNQKWRIWPLGYGFEYTFRSGIHSASLLPLCRQIVAEVLPLEAITGSTLTDIKGSNQPLELELLDGIASPPEADELFYLKGSVTIEEKNEEGEKESVRKAFDFSILTPFLEFSGSHSIRHNSAVRAGGAWPKDLSIAQVSENSPLELQYLRLGIDYFKSYFGTSLLGFAPSVWQTLLFEATDREICVKLLADGVRDRSFNPFSGDSAAGKLDKILQRLFSLSPGVELLARNRRQA